jgi:hypothetical protein
MQIPGDEQHTWASRDVGKEHVVGAVAEMRSRALGVLMERHHHSQGKNCQL